MFGKLLAALMAPSPSLPVADARLALAALLVRIARADGSYAPEEAFRIDRVLAHRHALSPFAASDLRLRAEALEAEAPDTVRFTRALKDAGGIPAHGNQRSEWEAGCRFDHPNPEHR